jgi:GTP-binding protein Era
MNASTPTGFRCGMVAIVGRPNVGKSTLMNALVGQKVSITSRKAQTTRHRITGIHTLEDAQYIFVDTPGFQTKHSGALNRSLNRAVTSTLTSVDAILFVIEAGRFGPDDQKVLDLIPPSVPTLLIANKLDRVSDKDSLFPFMQQVSALHQFTEIVPLSAKNPDDIKRLMATVKPFLPEGSPIYGEDDLTDRSERFPCRRNPARESFPLDWRRTALHQHRADREVRDRRSSAPHFRDHHGGSRHAQGDDHRSEGRQTEADQHRSAPRHGKAVRRPRVSGNLHQGEEWLGRQRSRTPRVWVRMTRG